MAENEEEFVEDTFGEPDEGAAPQDNARSHSEEDEVPDSEEDELPDSADDERQVLSIIHGDPDSETDKD